MRFLWGCGCVCAVIAAIIFAFYLGCRHGKPIERKINEAAAAVAESAKENIKAIDQQVQKTKESVSDIYRDNDTR